MLILARALSFPSMQSHVKRPRRPISSAAHSMVGLLVVALLAPRDTHAQAQTRWTSLNDYLERGIGLTAAQRSALARGEVVGRVLPMGDDRDIGVFAAVQVAVPRSLFRERQLAFAQAIRAPSRRVVQQFGNPASDADVRQLELSDDEVKDLRACRANRCDFKLPAVEMDTMRAMASGAGRAQLNSYVRRRLLDFVADYRRRGNAAMPVYDDRGRVRATDALAALLDDSSHVYKVVPALDRFLRNYPRETLPDASDVLFWSIDDLPHVRPVLRVMHTTVLSPPELSGATVVASKQVYANHYFEAGLETLTALDGAKPGAITLIAVRLYRFDNLPGGVLNIRGRVRSGMLSNAESDLARLKRDYESSTR